MLQQSEQTLQSSSLCFLNICHTRIHSVMSDLIQLDQIGHKLPHHDAEMFRDRVADLLNSRSKAFPGAQPVSFAKQHFDALCESELVSQVDSA